MGAQCSDGCSQAVTRTALYGTGNLQNEHMGHMFQGPWLHEMVSTNTSCAEAVCFQPVLGVPSGS